MEVHNNGVGALKQKAELVFIPAPAAGHFLSTIEMVRRLINRDDRLSITLIVMKLPSDDKFTSYTKSLIDSAISDRIRFIELPLVEAALDMNAKDIVSLFMETYKPHVKDAISKLVQSSSTPDSPGLVGFVVDMFTTTMIDVADEFGIPTYVWFSSGGAFLTLMLYLQNLKDEHGVDSTEFENTDIELVVPGFENAVPARVLPFVVLKKDAAPGFLNHARRYRETKGIVVSTFVELETNAVKFLSDDVPVPVYPVGPILNFHRDSSEEGLGGTHEKEKIVAWLDQQPPSSVVFLCFGSNASFGVDQVREIACALEHSGHRFVWSLRRPGPMGAVAFPGDYHNPHEILPEGFLDRTAEVGKIIGWAPQVAILSHPAIGGFVTHCGWNSVLETLWYGVPFAAWPIESEQQFVAFEMVIELGLAVEIKLDYRKDYYTARSLGDDEVLVRAEDIERGIRRLMELDSEIRRRVKMLSERSKMALMEGGSSWSSLGGWIGDMMNNLG